jgi:hypothetical protein
MSDVVDPLEPTNPTQADPSLAATFDGVAPVAPFTTVTPVRQKVTGVGLLYKINWYRATSRSQTLKHQMAT